MFPVLARTQCYCYCIFLHFPSSSITTDPRQHRDLMDEFHDAYEEYKDQIFRHCYFRTFDREIAKDLLHEAFIKTWEYLKSGKEVENLRAFLYRVATNLIINYKRKMKSVSLEKLQEAGFDPGERDAMEDRDWIQEEHVMRVLSRIDDAYRTVIALRYVEGLQPAEIAEVINESANVVSVRLHRGLKMLESLLKKDE